MEKEEITLSPFCKLPFYTYQGHDYRALLTVVIPHRLVCSQLYQSMILKLLSCEWCPVGCLGMK